MKYVKELLTYHHYIVGTKNDSVTPIRTSTKVEELSQNLLFMLTFSSYKGKIG